MTDTATTYRLTAKTADLMASLTVLPLSARQDVLRRYAEDHGPAALADLCAQAIGMANSVNKNCRDFLEVIGVVHAGMHPYSAEKLNAPTMLGAAMGAKLAQGIDPAKTCAGCAFRCGTAANQSPSTVADATDCTDTRAGDAFMCHAHRDALDNPVRACAGWAQWIKAGGE